MHYTIPILIIQSIFFLILGYKYLIQDNVRMVQEPEWCAIPCGYAAQAVLRDVRAHVLPDGGQYSTPQEAYPPGSSVFLLTHGQHYGAHATVSNICMYAARAAGRRQRVS